MTWRQLWQTPAAAILTLDLAGARRQELDVLDDHRLLGLVEHRCAHCVSPLLVSRYGRPRWIPAGSPCG